MVMKIANAVTPTGDTPTNAFGFPLCPKESEGILGWQEESVWLIPETVVRECVYFTPGGSFEPRQVLTPFSWNSALICRQIGSE